MSRLRAFLAEFDARELLSGAGPSTVVALCCFYDWRMLPRLERLLAAGYDAVYMVIPLAYMAAAGGQRLRKTMVGVALAVFLLLTTNLVLAKAQSWPKNWALDDPPRFLWPLAVAAVLALAGFVAAKVDLDEWGIGLGDWRWWGPKLGVALGIIVPASFLAVAVVPGLRSYYPSDPQGRASLVQLFIGQGLRGACLFGEEFFWHGFALFAISRTHGRRAAVIFTSFGYFMLHKGKPELEMLSSFVGSALLAVACLRCRTFWPAFLGHWPMNFCVELGAFLVEGPRTDALHRVHGIGG